MLILHTADLHLKQKEPSRFKILEWILNKANTTQVDAVVIAGDLFDSDTDANILRHEVRKIFERTNAEIILLPGNHDAEAYSVNYDYGKNVHQLIQKPFTHFTIKNIDFVAIPFQPVKLSECTLDLDKRVDILIAHGTLYDFSIVSQLREEDVEYMPIYPDDLENLCRCALLGHIHSSFIDKNYDKTRVLYAGAPVALSKKCHSPRKVILIEMDKHQLNTTIIDVEISPYYVNLTYFVFPGSEEKVISNVDEALRNISDKNVLPSINICGYIAESETEFKKRLTAVTEKYQSNIGEILIEMDNIKYWEGLMKNSFVQRFVEKTAGLSDEVRLKIFELIFPHFSEIV